MSRSPFRSSTSLALLALAVAVAATTIGCGDDDCGPQGAPTSGLVAGDDQITITYGNLTAGLNNDCPDADAPDGIVSMTIMGQQTDGTGLLTLCVSRPDRFASEELGLGNDVAASDVHVVDVTGSANNCTFRLDTTRPPTGTASSDGLCNNGAGTEGFALVVDGALSLQRTCGTTVDSVSVTLRGRVAVAAQ
ncbi:MAG TPA: hypothetical protein VFQ53_41745 [Kofleriaceae bacterium]|nr:hypothetical protein [Kofleriaceae bacterium]